MATKHIIDAPTLIWHLENNPRLGTQAGVVIEDDASELVLPVIALAEAAFAVERGRTSIPGVADLTAAVDADARVQVYPLDRAVFDKSQTLTVIPEMHDRFIVATALCLADAGHTTSVLTKDPDITGFGLVTVIW